MGRSLYEILDVDKAVDQAALRAAYLQRRGQLESLGTEEALNELKLTRWAYDELSDSTRRQMYDVRQAHSQVTNITALQISAPDQDEAMAARARLGGVAAAFRKNGRLRVIAGALGGLAVGVVATVIVMSSLRRERADMARPLRAELTARSSQATVLAPVTQATEPVAQVKARAEDAARRQREAEEKSAEATAIERFKDRIRITLKDPDSAQFQGLHLAPDAAALCGQINAKNGFGGYVGFRPFVATMQEVRIRPDFNVKTMLDDGTAEYVSLRKRARCIP